MGQAVSRSANGAANGAARGDVGAVRCLARAVGDVAAFVQAVRALDAGAIEVGVGLDDLALLRAQKALAGSGVTVRDVAAWVKAVAAERKKRAPRQAFDPSEEWRSTLRIRKGEVAESFGNLCIILEHTYGDRLTFDAMAAVPHLDGKAFKDEDISAMRCAIEADEGLEFSDGEMRAGIMRIATARSFHPVRDYLRGLVWDGVPRLERVAADLLGARDELSAVYLCRFFVSAVARALDPGCKVDTCLVLVGDEGMKKSTFFRVLGGAWFKDSKVDITDRKGMMLMHSAWVYEWPEIDRMLERKHDSDVKAFVSQSSDSYVPMYGRAVDDRPRSSVAVGTTNKEQFIASATGSRRWWPVSVQKRIDADWLAANRDQLWAEAVYFFDAFTREKAAGMVDDANPYRWWLSDEEDARRAARNEEHLTVSPDLERVESWLAGLPITCPICQGSGDSMGRAPDGTPYPCPACSAARTITRNHLRADASGRQYVTCSDILSGPLGVPLERHEQNANRASSVLRRLGWRAGPRIRPSGATGPRIRPYYEPDIERDAIRGES